MIGKAESGDVGGRGQDRLEQHHTRPNQFLVAPCLADVDDDTVLAFREQYAQREYGSQV
jgi:hypothetical protein